jgi:hypothetical protein
MEMAPEFAESIKKGYKVDSHWSKIYESLRRAGGVMERYSFIYDGLIFYID